MREKGGKGEGEGRTRPPCIPLLSEWSFSKNDWRNSIDSRKYVPCGALKSLPVFHLSADYIFWSFGIIEHMLVCFAILLKPALGGGGRGEGNCTFQYP